MERKLAKIDKKKSGGDIGKKDNQKTKINNSFPIVFSFSN